MDPGWASNLKFLQNTQMNLLSKGNFLQFW